VAAQSLTRTRRCRGLALVTVLWILALLALLATNMLTISRNDTRMAMRGAQLTAATTAADSAIRLALLQIHTPPYAHLPAGFASQWQLRLFGCAIEVRVEREAGRLDVNANAERLLAAVLTAGGVDLAGARSRARRITERRIAQGPYESVAEVRELLGPEATRIEDAFTVSSTRSPTIVREHAHPLVSAALDTLSGAQPAPQRSIEPVLQPALGQAFRVRACATQLQTVTCRTAIARLTGRRQPFLIHAWYTSSAW
jgi:hypothetical protein